MAKRKKKQQQKILCEAKNCTKSVDFDNKQYCSLMMKDIDAFTEYSLVVEKYDCVWYRGKNEILF